jgi:hypothetical protein
LGERGTSYSTHKQGRKKKRRRRRKKKKRKQ